MMSTRADQLPCIQQAAHDEMEKIGAALTLPGLNSLTIRINLRRDGRVDHVTVQPEYRSAFNHADSVR